MSTTIAQLETPEVLVNHDRLSANIERVQSIANANKLAVRPHIKTHKCLEIAQLQLSRGAVGVTASKVDEAIVFIESVGVRSVTIAYPVIDSRKLARVAAAAKAHAVELRIIVDSERGVQAAAQSGAAFGVFLKIDVGLHRCGIAPSSPEVLRIAEQIRTSERLQFTGLLSHAGQAYGARDKDEIARIAAHERDILLRVRDNLERGGINVSEISVGSTPTVFAATIFEGLSEIRPGNYVFLDATAVRLGIATFDDVALSVLATIVSANDRYFIIDAGSKVLSSDLGAHGSGGAGYGLAFPLDHASPLRVARLSEEHGWVERGERGLPIGSKLRVIPNHACPVANLAERLTVTSGDAVIDQWQVAARGKVR